ncbi:MAG: TonB-dependent receptor [Planctomycetes bacterium]|nr:TonB-dependent receptor [Planctomycetota bacterium]
MARGRLLHAAAVAAVLSASVAAQQAGSIRGQVQDRDFRAPLPEAQVSLVETGQRTTTDDQGAFTFANLRPGTYTLVVAKEGYVRQVRSGLVVAAGQLTEVTLELSGDFTDLEPFVVSDVLRIGAEGDAALLELRLESPALVDTISSDLMSRAGASDAASALRLVTGASLQDGKTAVIRGLPDRYVSSQMNGVRLPSADEDKRAVELDQFPSEVISSIQVSKTFTPDQLGDASGGAVDVRLKGVPDQPFTFQYKVQASHNTQVTGRDGFVASRGGGLNYWGGATTPRGEQEDGESWDGAVGTVEESAPFDYKWSASVGGRVELSKGVRIGGTANVFYERDSELEKNGIDDSYRIAAIGEPMTPAIDGQITGDFLTALFDVRQGKRSVQWGGLGTLGIETDRHAVTFAYLFTRSADDVATRADDTRGKEFFFPGHDPDVPTTPGHEFSTAAPYQRYQTLEYTERTTSTLQLSGVHRLDGLSPVRKAPAELDWTLARSSADRDQPDKRLLSTAWADGLFTPIKPAAAFTLGNLQRTFKTTREDSEQYTLGVKVPFEAWNRQQGYLRFGTFRDRVDRTYDQETYSNFGDNQISFAGDFFEDDWSQRWPFEDHPIFTDPIDNGIDEGVDVDYEGRQTIEAWYVMLDLPLARRLNLVGGVRWESTKLWVVNTPEAGATWLPDGQNLSVTLEPGDADVDFREYDVLPSVGLVWRPADELTLRTSYSETVARQSFKELTPILNQEYLGGPIFIGNPDLRMSGVRNYDVRADWTPLPTSLLSASWFRKDIDDPIEYVEKSAAFSFTTARNYPRGQLAGFELEGKQGLAPVLDALAGLAVGGNVTWIDASVNLPDDEILRFEAVNGERPRTVRDMTSTPDYLTNWFLTWELPSTGTQMGLFYTVQGETLLQGSGPSSSGIVPATYLKQFDTLNFSLSQRLGANVRLTFAAKNLTDAETREIYRSEYVQGDTLRRRGSDGIEFSLTLGGEFRF